jgi:transcriptional regulator with XRE-family HTH domain
VATSREIIGKIIKRQREKNNLSLQELANMLGVDRQYVWRLENGKINMTIDYLDNIIDKLKSKREDFFNINN